jgi:predicted 3-demethylubiquinone-9 3-methyltransferase (glyoxalase superfamily)
VKFYTAIFRKSKILKMARYPEAAAKQTGRPVGSVMTIEFELDGQRFVALNGGPYAKFNEAVSFVVNCKSQAELDRYWNALSTGGKKRPCGWLKDKYGLSWQIVPAAIEEWLSSRDPAQGQRVMEAVLKMKKLDIKTLKKTAGKSGR